MARAYDPELWESELGELESGWLAERGAVYKALPRREAPQALLRMRRPLTLPPELLRGPFMVLDRFAFDRFALIPNHYRQIDRIARYVVFRVGGPRPIQTIRMVGHADSRGTASYNQVLGRRRALAVQSGLMTAINRLIPGLARQITFAAESRGATQPIAPSSSPEGRARNRRVSVALLPRRGPVVDINFLIPKGRKCCMLAPTVVPTAQDSNFANPSSLGVHNTSSEVNGIVYSGRYGFLDLAHIRDMCNLTKWAYDEIFARRGLAPFTLKLPEGEATIPTSLPPHEWISVARAIAYDDGLAHEILSYDEHAPPREATTPRSLLKTSVPTTSGPAWQRLPFWLEETSRPTSQGR
jgi:outer membrane protein OmpA-like peptidoglycan-associated protein